MRDDPRSGAQAIHELGDEVERTLDELRALAHGVYPSLLSDRGLDDALRSVALEAPVKVHYRSSGLTRYPAEVEIADDRAWVRNGDLVVEIAENHEDRFVPFPPLVRFRRANGEELLAELVPGRR